jgi:phage shock protein C
MSDQPTTKKLHRSASQKMIGGVCGGLAEYFELDPTIMRVIFVAAAFLGSAGFWAYIILWLVLPVE